MTKFSKQKKLVAVLFVYFFSACHPTKEISKPYLTNATSGYELVNNWGKESDDSIAGQLSAVAVDKNGNVFVFRRTGRRWTTPFPDSLISSATVSVLDGKTGKIISTWGANQFIMPHGITVDKDNNVWITDVALQQVFKFTHDGKLLMTLGVAKETGDDSIHFNLPTDVAVDDDGSFYVSDGYGNNRVIKFSARGKYLYQWGTEGSNAGQFELPHTVDLDAHGNVYVADRENNRIEKFNAKGQFLQEWKNNQGSKLYAIAVDRTRNQLIAVDFASENKVVKGADIIQLDTSLTLLARFGRSGSYNGPVCVYHDVAVNKNGNIYTANILGNTVQKFRKIFRKS